MRALRTRRDIRTDAAAASTTATAPTRVPRPAHPATGHDTAATDRRIKQPARHTRPLGHISVHRHGIAMRRPQSAHRGHGTHRTTSRLPTTRCRHEMLRQPATHAGAPPCTPAHGAAPRTCPATRCVDASQKRACGEAGASPESMEQPPARHATHTPATRHRAPRWIPRHGLGSHTAATHRAARTAPSMRPSPNGMAAGPEKTVTRPAIH